VTLADVRQPAVVGDFIRRFDLADPAFADLVAA